MKEQRNIYVETTYLADRDTGEVKITESKSVTKLPAEPPYVKLYLDDLCKLVNVPKANEDVLKYLLKKLDYEGYITISSRYRKLIEKELNIASRTLTNRIQALKNQGLIKTVGKNEYEANPHFFGRGPWTDIYNRRAQGSFSMTIKYDSEGKREISTNVNTYEIKEIKEEEQLDLLGNG